MSVIFKQNLKFSFNGIKIETFEKDKSYPLSKENIEILNDFFKQEAPSFFDITEDKEEVKATEDNSGKPLNPDNSENQIQAEISEEKKDSEFNLEIINSLSDIELLELAEEQKIDVSSAGDKEEVKAIILKALNINE